MEIVYIDFDGTVVDNMQRYHKAYSYAVDTAIQEAFIKGDIFDIKQIGYLAFSKVMRKGEHSQLANLSGVPVEYLAKYYEVVKQQANNELLLHLDKPLPGSICAIHRMLAVSIDVVVVTLRDSRQVKSILNANHLELDIIGGDNLKLFPQPNHEQAKTFLLQCGTAYYNPERSKKSLMIGDTRADIVAAKSEGIPVCAVTSGMRNPSYLQSCDPDYLLPSLADAVDLVLNELAEYA